MSDLYGPLWTSQRGDIGGHDFLAWSKAIESFGPEVIKRAVYRVVDEGAEYPVNLIKFLSYCREVTPRMYRPPKLPPPPKDRNPRSKSQWRKEARKLGLLP